MKIKIFKPHRLKIVEQVIIVTLCSIIIPLIVTGIIVNNINRQALARELGKTAQALAETVDENIYDMFESDDAKIKELDTQIAAKQKSIDEEKEKGIELKVKENISIFIKSARKSNQQKKNLIKKIV